MKQESSGETKKVDWADLLIERTARSLSEAGMEHYMTDFLLQMRNESEWIGRSEHDISIMTGAVLSFAEYLKENFYHVSRN